MSHDLGMNLPKILITRRWPEAAVRHLRERYDVTLDASDRALSTETLIAAMHDFDALCPTLSDRIDAAILGVREPRVRVIANYGAGYDHIDMTAARAAGMTVTNTPGVLTDATADLAILLMLMASRRAGEGERELRAGRWAGWQPTHLMGTSLTGKLLGLVGFGRIAQATGLRARAFGLRIAYHSRHRADPPAGLEDAEYHPTLDALVERADIVSLHCPGGAATNHLIDRARLARMKRTAILINTARGSVVDEVALADALRDGELAVAGLDVYEGEPSVSAALLALENVVLLPHLGSATVETRTAMGKRVAANLDAFFDGKVPPDRVA